MKSARTRLAAALATAAILALSGGCVWSGGIGTGPDPPRGPVAPEVPAQPLELGRETSGEINCDAGECIRRYEIQLRARGHLNVRIEPGAGPSNGVLAILSDPAQNVISRVVANEPGRSFSVGAPAEAGRYTVALQSGSGKLDYKLMASLDTSGPPEATQLDRDVAPLHEKPKAGASPAGGAAALQVRGLQGAQEGPGFTKNPRTNLRRYNTFAFGQDPQELLNAPPGSYVGNPFIAEQIQRAIRYKLSDYNYDEVPVDQADALVTFHTGSSSFAYYTISGVVYNTSYSAWYDTWTPYGVAGVGRGGLHTEGTLVIDIIDIASKELVWHGWTTKTTGWQDNAVVIKEAVAEILDQIL